MKNQLPRLLMTMLAVAVLSGGAGLRSAQASAHDKPRAAGAAHHEDDDELDRMRDAVKRGDIKSLAVLRRIVLSQVDGEIVSVKFKREHSHGTYEFKILRADGHLVEAEIDAASGVILEIEND